MKRLLIKSLLAGCVTVLALCGLQSCTDDWDNHYDADSTVKYDGSLMDYLNSHPEFSDFAEIIKATGYDRELDASQVMTLLVPKNDSFDKQEWLDLINKGQTQLVLDRFIKNHVARYSESMNMVERDVPMLSKKNVTFGTMTDATIEDVPVSEMNITCKNGVIHVLDGYVPYAYNIYEYIAKDYMDNWENYINGGKTIEVEPSEEGPDDNPNVIFPEDEVQHESMYAYLDLMHIDSLVENRSVSRGIDENGEVIWVDKYIIENNKLLRRIDAFVYREDSLYLTILPSFEAYENRYNGIHGLFNFNVSLNSDPVVRDSLQRYWAHYYSMSDLSYNLNMNNMSDPQSQLYDNGEPVDTLFSAAYNRWDWPYSIYRNPFGEGGLLSTYDEIIECSNGYVYRMNEYPFSVFDNVFKKITLETENTGFIYEDDAKLFTNTSTTGITRVSSVADSISGNGYVHIEPVSSNRNTEFTYYLPNTLSGQYDIYVKFLPLQVFDEDKTRLPVQFRASLYERSATNGGFPAESKPTYTFMNPVDGKSNFHTNPDRIDSVYVGTYKFQFCYQGTNPGVLFKLESYVLTSQAKSYTKEMLIDKIVLVPSREGHNNDGLYIEREAGRR